MSMEQQLGKYVPLKMVVAMFSDAHDLSEGDQDRYWILGMRALVDLNYDVAAQPKTVRLPVAGNMTVPFPADCISWTKIGLLNEAGEISTLKINNALTTFRDNNPQRLSDLKPDINDGVTMLTNVPIFFNYYFNSYYYNLYGVGGGLIQYDSCRIDDAHQLVVLPPEFKYDHIMFEYISSPERDGDFKVPLALQEAVIAFIEWKMKLGAAQMYYGEVTKARRRLEGKKVTLQTVAQVIRETGGQYLHA